MIEPPSPTQLRSLAALGYPDTSIPTRGLAVRAIADIRFQQRADGRWVPPPGVARGPRASVKDLERCRRLGYEGPQNLPAAMVPSVCSALRRFRQAEDG